MNKLVFKKIPASASRRFFARLIDYGFVFIIITIISYIICLNDNITQFGFEKTWKYSLISLLAFIIFYIFTFLLPFFCHYTLGMFFLHLRIIKKKNKKWIWCLFKKEIFQWIIVGIINLIMGIYLSTLTPQECYIFFEALFKNEENNFFIISRFFQISYLIHTSIVIFLIIDLFVHTKKNTILDNYCFLTTYHLLKIKKNKIKNITKKMPGEESLFDIKQIEHEF